MHTAKNLVHKHLNIYFLGVFNKTIIPLALVGYHMIIANSVLPAALAKGGLFNLEKTMVSILHKKLEYNVETLKYKRLEVMQPRIKNKPELPVGK